jgi:hypothetical protein
MQDFDTRIATALCTALLLAASDCSQPNSETRFEPKITASQCGLFSYDITFTLNSASRVDWSRGHDNQVTNPQHRSALICEKSM